MCQAFYMDFFIELSHRRRAKLNIIQQPDPRVPDFEKVFKFFAEICS